MSKRIKSDPEEEPEFQISSMVDILMTLLIFFVATAQTEVTEQLADLELPEASSSDEKSEREGQLTINIERITHAITVQKAIYNDTQQLIPIIQDSRRAALETRGPNAHFRVLIRADRNVPYSKVRDVMRAAAEAGVVDVIFATTTGEE